MNSTDGPDFWDPENYPWQVGKDSLAAEWNHTDGYEDQWEVIAQYVADGGEVETAPYPSLRKYAAFVHRPVVEGFRQARIDAALLAEAGTYDPKLILEAFAERHREEDARDAEIQPGEFERPANWDTARVHTTMTRLFTDSVVFSVCGDRFEPTPQATRLVPMHGRLHLLGHADIDTGIDLDGEYKVDLVDAGWGGPGPGASVLRLVWGSEASIVGAIPSGWIKGFISCGGLGPAGASREARQVAGELPVATGLATLTTESGMSVWLPGSDRYGHFTVFLAVDKDRTPVGVILDTTDITQFSWYDYVLDEGFTTDWPPDAREFDPETDIEGINPNVALTPPPEKEVWSVEKMLADDSTTEEFTGEPYPGTELGQAYGEAQGLRHQRVETMWTLTNADGEHIVVIADTATEALDRIKNEAPDEIIINIKKRWARWVWDV